MHCRFVVVVMGLVMWTSASANDGRDRHARHYPTVLQLFPEPTSAASGYTVLAQDMPGGADGDQAMRWAQPHAVALVRLAAHQTYRTLGAAVHPMAIFDASAENGDTPIQWEQGRAPRGRHPGGSHDGGINLDLGYYLTSLKGQVFSPDYSACSEHFDPQASGTPKDAWICRGPADRLDVPRQACFYLHVFALDQELFGGDLIGQVGIDAAIEQAVLKQVDDWVDGGSCGATRALRQTMASTMTHDMWEGWAYAHHHHTHLRLRDLDLQGRLGAGVVELGRRERAMDGATSLRVRLLSTGLARAVEVELPGHLDLIDHVRYRVDRGPWHTPPTGDVRRRVVIDLDGGPRATAGRLSLQAEFISAAGEEFVLEQQLVQPRQDPRLALAIEPARIQAWAARQGAAYRCGVTFPDVYSHYVTKVVYRSWREGVSVDVTAPSPTAEVELPAGPLQRLEARVTFSGRQVLTVPLVISPAPDHSAGDPPPAH